MLAFIRAQPSVVERLLRHVETPSFVDLLVRIIQLDEQPGGAGVLEVSCAASLMQSANTSRQWLSSENLMSRLLDLLAPTETPDIHTVVAELIKGIISMATPAPGAGLTELQHGPASNRFARELAHPDSVSKLAAYILADFEVPQRDENDETLPSADSCTSSVVHSIAIIIELIRKNNSDYFEPYLFHTLRNRLIQVQQQLQTTDEDGGRETLEHALREMVERMGVVHLGSVLELLGARLELFQQYLRKPRSFVSLIYISFRILGVNLAIQNGPLRTTVGTITPLTFERYRICELFAELLHCSNMALLNRSSEFNHLYDSEGRLQGGLSALEELARVIALNTSEERDNDAMMRAPSDEMEQLPVTNSIHSDSSLLDSDEDMSSDEPGSSDDDSVTMEEIGMDDDPSSFPISAPHPQSPHSTPPPPPSSESPGSSPPLQHPPHLVPSSPNVASPSPTEIALGHASASSLKTPDSDTPASASTGSLRSHSSKRNSRRLLSSTSAPLPVGEMLKRRFVDLNVASTLLVRSSSWFPLLLLY